MWKHYFNGISCVHIRNLTDNEIQLGPEGWCKGHPHPKWQHLTVHTRHSSIPPIPFNVLAKMGSSAECQQMIVLTDYKSTSLTVQSFWLDYWRNGCRCTQQHGYYSLFLCCTATQYSKPLLVPCGRIANQVINKKLSHPRSENIHIK